MFGDREPNFFSQQKDTGVFRIEIRIETIFSQLSNVVTISFRNCYKLTEKHLIPVFDSKTINLFSYKMVHQ